MEVIENTKSISQCSPGWMSRESGTSYNISAIPTLSRPNLFRIVITIQLALLISSLFYNLINGKSITIRESLTKNSSDRIPKIIINRS